MAGPSGSCPAAAHPSLVVSSASLTLLWTTVQLTVTKPLQRV
jgi:hypothetical protein